MSDFRSRLLKERDELEDRTDKLSKFITTETYLALPEIERDDLIEQLSYMRQYLNILQSRAGRLCN